MKQISRSKSRQGGFAMIEVIVIVLVIAAIGGVVAWRVYDTQQQNKAQTADQAKLISGPLVPIDRQKLAEAQQRGTASTSASGERVETSTNTGSSPSSQAAGRAAPSTASQSSNGGSAPAASPSPAAPPASSITRPTAEWCSQHPDSFTNLWVTDNSQHTYQVWENGGWVTKTETGTAARNFDTMQVVGVVPYLTQPAWAVCNGQRPGYITVYYKPSGSVYTYNWLVAYEHLSLTHP